MCTSYYIKLLKQSSYSSFFSLIFSCSFEQTWYLFNKWLLMPRSCLNKLIWKHASTQAPLSDTNLNFKYSIAFIFMSCLQLLFKRKLLKFTVYLFDKLSIQKALFLIPWKHFLNKLKCTIYKNAFLKSLAIKELLLFETIFFQYVFLIYLFFERLLTTF